MGAPFLYKPLNILIEQVSASLPILQGTANGSEELGLKLDYIGLGPGRCHLAGFFVSLATYLCFSFIILLLLWLNRSI